MLSNYTEERLSIVPYRKPVVESTKVSYEFNQTFVVATMETKDILRIHFLIRSLYIL